MNIKVKVMNYKEVLGTIAPLLNSEKEYHDLFDLIQDREDYEIEMIVHDAVIHGTIVDIEEVSEEIEEFLDLDSGDYNYYFLDKHYLELCM